jgi:hypothetical protein
MPNRLFDPLSTRPRKLADILANMIDQPTAEDRGTIKPFMAGALQGVGDLASDMTSPFSLATMALGGGAASRAMKGVQEAAPLVKRAIGPAIDLGAEFVAPFQRAGYNAKRAKGLAKEAEAVKDMSLKGGTGRAIQPTSNDDVLNFMKARERAKSSASSMTDRLKSEKGVMNIGPTDRDILRNRIKLKHEAASRVPKEILDLKHSDPVNYLTKKWKWVDEELERMGHKGPEGWNMEHQTLKDMEFMDKLKGRKPMQSMVDE